jgi:pyruvate-ferredoxin/flavodoxin oxidoreductase
MPQYTPTNASGVSIELGLQLDSAPPKVKVQDYLLSENRFKMLTKSKPEVAKQLFAAAQKDVETRYAYYQSLASRKFGPQPAPAPAEAAK